MKIIKIILFISIITSGFSFAAEKNETFDGSGGRDDFSYLDAKNSNFKKGNDALKQALKLKEKNKIEKSNKRLEKAISYFVLAYKENPNNLDILNYLGLTYYMVGDTIMSEIYYNQALDIDPNNNLVNQRLGELYFKTKRTTLAKEKLEILSNCNCEEYSVLKMIIDKK